MSAATAIEAPITSCRGMTWPPDTWTFTPLAYGRRAQAANELWIRLRAVVGSAEASSGGFSVRHDPGVCPSLRDVVAPGSVHEVEQIVHLVERTYPGFTIGGDPSEPLLDRIDKFFDVGRRPYSQW